MCSSDLEVKDEYKNTEGNPEIKGKQRQRMQEADPYNEEILTRLIGCLYKSGRQSEAKQQYDRMLKLYQEDLELDFKKTFKEIVAQEEL